MKFHPRSLVLLLILLTSCRIEIADDGYSIRIGEEVDSPTCEPPTYIQPVMLERINAARAIARFCGPHFFNAAPRVTENPLLLQAATEHAQDLAHYDLLAHLGSDSSDVHSRVEKTGYVAQLVGENLGTTYPSPDTMLNQWLINEDDCANIMNPLYTEIGVACAHRQTPASQHYIYWTLVIATRG